MQNNPLVSVVMPVLNTEKYVAKAVESILSQNYTHFEFIIIDDGSTDNTGKILESFCDPRISIIKNKKSQGVALSLNLGLSCAKGEFIIRQDADDISLPNRIKKQLSYLVDHPDIGVLGSWFQYIDNDGNYISKGCRNRENYQLKWDLLFTCPLAHPTTAMRKDILEEIGGYRNYETEDYDLWARLYEKTRFANLPEVMVLYRRHVGSKTVKYKNIHNLHAFEIMMNLRSQLINRTITEQEKVWLGQSFFQRKIENASGVESNANFILELMANYLSRNAFSEQEIKWIKQDCAKYLFLLAYDNQINSLPTSKRIMRNSFIMYPRLMFSRRAFEVFIGFKLTKSAIS